jgi:hypothetical protein
MSFTILSLAGNNLIIHDDAKMAYLFYSVVFPLHVLNSQSENGQAQKAPVCRVYTLIHLLYSRLFSSGKCFRAERLISPKVLSLIS